MESTVSSDLPQDKGGVIIKRLCAAVFALFLILSSTLLSSWWVSSLTHDLSEQLEVAHELTQKDDWEGALEITVAVSETWQENDFLLHAIMRHTEIDQIWITTQMVMEYIKLEEMDQYAAANRHLITQLELLGEVEPPSLHNVL